MTGTVERGECGGRLRVLFISGWYPHPGNPADGVFVREHARAASRHHDVTVLHTQGPTPELGVPWTLAEVTDLELTAGVRTFRTACVRTGVPLTQYAAYLYGIFRAFGRLASLGVRPDLLHAHVYDPAFPAVLLGRAHGIPVIVTEHFSALQVGGLSQVERAKARFAYRRADSVLPVSASLAAAVREIGAPRQLVVVPNAVDLSLFRPGAPRPATGGPARLLFVGRLVSIKGLDHLLEALALLPATAGEWRLDVVGDGSERQRYEERAAALGLAGCVAFHGQRPKEEVARFLARSDLFVLPSEWETMGCAILEAVASGVPYVASRVGGVPEVVTGEGGILVPPADPPALARAIETMLGRLPALPRGSRLEDVSRFSLEAVGADLDRVYRSVTAARGRGAA